MTRITSTILAVMLLMNGTVTVMAASGLSDDLGVTLSPGVSDAMDNVTQEMKDGFSPEVSVTESLISMFVAGLQLLQVLVEGLYALPTMLMNLGFPSWIVTPLMAPLYMLSTLELVYVATGRDLV